ncbi:DUF6326 family protein [Wenyingzhuangia marina]|uniref:DoxX-like family protein n=1 Tax=Wenyingzhuangia marina TaxID=1195760 RepID=A0A1M5SE56_9FLAO|nr:DUF6326 family protein [Wenyingzhuangia marina]GGF61863.1 hypothetical protein GCM10011397_01220 [Wenyingzhuangia marina]SHH36749.1 hypothetical protein SAMN05444281_0261 [Wenyingzhuangia marina]
MNTLFFSKQQKLLSTLWIFVTFNYLYCDVIGIMDADFLKQYLTGNVDGLEITNNFLLMAGILMELPITMILLSKILSPLYNCWTNIGVASIKTLAMVTTLFIGTPTNYYLFFATIEISTTLFIIGYSWYWIQKLKQQYVSI